mmetsp:Transcript_26842/g.30676  ORF Transcript_26842/g.30676 Transcript_26842/m.30676 type:complete len:88 (-) Transcript_26842:362-625(-)
MLRECSWLWRQQSSTRELMNLKGEQLVHLPIQKMLTRQRRQLICPQGEVQVVLPKKVDFHNVVRMFLLCNCAYFSRYLIQKLTEYCS